MSNFGPQVHLGLSPDKSGWQYEALCSDEPELWFCDPTDKVGIRLAKATCNRCPVFGNCREDIDALEGSLAQSGMHGVWAAETPHERANRRRREKRQRLGWS